MTQFTWAVNANKRIASALDESLIKTAPGVILLKSNLREAQRTDRPGILYSGMDIIEEIAGLISERSLGEIKLNTKGTKSIVFISGASLNETRLVADSIKKGFVLKTAAAVCCAERPPARASDQGAGD